MAFTALRNPLRHTPLQMLVGWAPAGLVSTDPIRETVARAVPSGWVEHRSFWAVACDYATGKRTVFGRLDAPRADVADAAAASCAIPGFYKPVKIGRRRYVDGGVCSASNLDLLAGKGLDLVICMNPLSSRDAVPMRDPFSRLVQLTRSGNGRRLGHEARKVRESGTEVLLIQPTAADIAGMGSNWMSRQRRQDVIVRARETVAEQLQGGEVREVVRDLPPGEPHKLRRPSGHPSTWPELVPARRAA